MQGILSTSGIIYIYIYASIFVLSKILKVDRLCHVINLQHILLSSLEFYPDSGFCGLLSMHHVRP
jgi:hypothetical protein